MLTVVQRVPPVLGPLVDGNLCDISFGGHYCGQDAVREAIDVDGRARILCVEHARLYFPNANI